MPTSSLRALASSAEYNRRKSPRIAFHASLQQVLYRRGRSGARHDFLLQKDDIGIRLADGYGEVDEVGMLVTRMYRQRGYLVPVTEAADPIRRVTLEACYKNETVGTLTVNLDSGEGLQAESLYRDEIARFRREGARVCEFTRLALDAAEGAINTLAFLFHIGFIFAYRIHRATDLFIEVNPRHVLFYRRKLGFEQVGEERTCPRVNAPAVLLHKRLEDVARDLVRFGGVRTPENKSFYALWLPRAEEEALVNTIRATLDTTRSAVRAVAQDGPAIAGLARSA